MGSGSVSECPVTSRTMGARITNLQLEVNGQRLANLHLDDGETRTVEIGAAV